MSLNEFEYFEKKTDFFLTPQIQPPTSLINRKLRVIVIIYNLRMNTTGRSYTQNFLAVKNSHADMRTSHAQLLGKGFEHGEEDSKNKILL